MSVEGSIRAGFIVAKTVLATALGGAASALFPVLQGDTSLLFTPEGHSKMLHASISGAILTLIAYLTHSPFHQAPPPKG